MLLTEHTRSIDVLILPDAEILKDAPFVFSVNNTQLCVLITRLSLPPLGRRFGPSCVLLKRVPQGRTESGGIVLAANAGPRVPSGGVTLKKR